MQAQFDVETRHLLKVIQTTELTPSIQNHFPSQETFFYEGRSVSYLNFTNLELNLFYNPKVNRVALFLLNLDLIFEPISVVDPEIFIVRSYSKNRGHYNQVGRAEWYNLNHTILVYVKTGIWCKKIKLFASVSRENISYDQGTLATLPSCLHIPLPAKNLISIDQEDFEKGRARIFKIKNGKLLCWVSPEYFPERNFRPATNPFRELDLTTYKIYVRTIQGLWQGDLLEEMRENESSIDYICNEITLSLNENEGDNFYFENAEENPTPHKLTDIYEILKENDTLREMLGIRWSASLPTITIKEADLKNPNKKHVFCRVEEDKLEYIYLVIDEEEKKLNLYRRDKYMKRWNKEEATREEWYQNSWVYVSLEGTSICRGEINTLCNRTLIDLDFVPEALKEELGIEFIPMSEGEENEEKAAVQVIEKRVREITLIGDEGEEEEDEELF